MNYKTTLALVILLAIVGGYFYFVEYGNTTGYQAHEQQREAQSTPAIGEAVFTDDAPTADTIDHIDIQRGDREFIVQKQSGQWFQTQPVRFALDSQIPDTIARQFAELRYVQRIDLDPPTDSPSSKNDASDTPTLAQMGLDKPRATVTIGSGDKTWTLKLGKLAINGQGYVQVQGDDAVYVINPALHGAVLDQQINDWRSRSLGTFTAASSDSITLNQLDTDPIDLHKVDGRWRFDSKVIQRTSDEAIDDLFASVSRVWITDFIEDNPENLSIYGLDRPHLELIIQTPPAATSDGTSTTDTITRRLKIGRTDLEGKSRYATWATDDEPTLVVFTVDIDTAEALTRSMDDMRDPRVVVAKTQDVRELTVSQADTVTLHILRDPQSGYRFGEPQPGFDIDYSTTHALVKQLCELETTTYTNQLSDLGDPIAQVQLATATGTGEIHFSIYRTENSHTFVTQGEGVGYVVKTAERSFGRNPIGLVERLLGQPLGLRNRTILDVTPDEINRITLHRPDGVTYEFIQPDTESAWTLTGHEQYEDATFSSLLVALNPLRAEEWVPSYGPPGAGVVELVLDLTGHPQQTITIHQPTGLAASKELDTAFTLPQRALDLLYAEYRHRTLLSMSVAEIASVKIASDSTDITLSLDGQRFVSDHGEVDQSLAAGVFDTLAGLRVQRYVAPLNLHQQDIDFTVELTTTDGNTQTLSVVKAQGESVTATIDPVKGESYTEWFTLSRADADRLRAPLTDAEALIK